MVVQVGDKVKKAIFPVAGLGTRFLPATKANAKEMMPVVNKPLIQHAVEEAVSAGIDTLVFISGKSKRAIEDHFDRAIELERQLEERGQTGMLKVVRDVLPAGVSCIYLRQAAPLGLGHAVLCAEPVVGDEPFVVLLADDLILADGAGNCIEDLVEAYGEYDSNVVAVQKVERSAVDRYGILGGEEIKSGTWRVNALVEKPQAEDAPGDLAIIGRYLLKPGIFDFLRNTERGVGGEIQLTDALVGEIGRDNVIARLYRGRRYDCGNKLDYLVSNVEAGMLDPDIGADFRDYLRNLQVKAG